jgi:chromosome segregation ATPase
MPASSHVKTKTRKKQKKQKKQDAEFSRYREASQAARILALEDQINERNKKLEELYARIHAQGLTIINREEEVKRHAFEIKVRDDALATLHVKYRKAKTDVGKVISQRSTLISMKDGLLANNVEMVAKNVEMAATIQRMMGQKEVLLAKNVEMAATIQRMKGQSSGLVYDPDYNYSY